MSRRIVVEATWIALDLVGGQDFDRRERVLEVARRQLWNAVIHPAWPPPDRVEVA